MRFAGTMAFIGLVTLATAGPARPANAEGSAIAAAPGAAISFPKVFGSDELFSPDNSAFYKWNGMLARFTAERRQATQPCAAPGDEQCQPAEWRRLVDELRGLDLRNKLLWVNAAINRHPYIPSMRNWGESNHWETPFEFFRRSGQCQDYAITKYLLLRAAGVPADLLRVVVLRDMKLGLDHAVLVASLDGTGVMLDNQLPDVALVDSIRYYQPYYSINEEGWWLHRGPHARYAATATLGMPN
jgi:predicted transglutaminase-like cysteine proteinase